MKRDRDRFVGFAFAAADTLIELDRTLTIRYVAGAALLAKQLDPIGCDFIELIEPANRDAVAASLIKAKHGGRVPAMTVQLFGGAQPARPMVLSGWCLPDLEGHYFLALKGVAPAPSDAGTDKETGLLDGDGFRAAVARAATEGGGTMTLIDVEGLENVRDRLRSEESALLMDRIGAVLKGSAIDGAVAGRAGAETFGVVHRDADVGAKLRRSLHDLVAAADPTGVGVRVREGSLRLDGDSLSKEEAAEAVLYAMRKFGESRQGSASLGTLSECCATMVSDSVERMARFKRTVTGDEFRIVVQPIVEIRTRRPQHYEVLSRFGDAEEGSPQTMIAFAEEVGAIADFDLRVVERAIASLGEARGLGVETLSLAVNLSMRTIERPDFIEALNGRLAGHPELRPRIMFEITETARINDLRAANRAVQVLRRAGHRVCLDDFGAGSAAFEYLRTFEVDAIKIDGAYVTRAVGSTRSRAFLKAMAGLCLDMGVDVVGEKIEDEGTAQFLDECGVTFGQGYLYGRPAPLGAILAGRIRAARPLARRTRRIFTSALPT